MRIFISQNTTTFLSYYLISKICQLWARLVYNRCRHHNQINVSSYRRHLYLRIDVSSCRRHQFKLMKYHRVVSILVFLIFLILLIILTYYLSERIIQMKNITFISRKMIVSTLTSITYNFWISKIKSIAMRSRMWEYVNSERLELKLMILKYSRFSNYIKSIVILTSAFTRSTILEASIANSLETISCVDYESLSKSQKRSYHVKERAYRHI